jgi:hypothetical protein
MVQSCPRERASRCQGSQPVGRAVGPEKCEHTEDTVGPEQCEHKEDAVGPEKCEHTEDTVTKRRCTSDVDLCVCVCVWEGGLGGGAVVSEKWTELHWGPSPRAHTHLAFVWHVASDSERRVLVGRHPFGETRVGNLARQQRSQVKSSKKQSQGLNAVHVRGHLTLRMCSK